MDNLGKAVFQVGVQEGATLAALSAEAAVVAKEAMAGWGGREEERVAMGVPAGSVEAPSTELSQPARETPHITLYHLRI